MPTIIIGVASFVAIVSNNAFVVELYRYRVKLIIEIADTDYVADYDTDYKRSIITDINFRRPF